MGTNLAARVNDVANGRPPAPRFSPAAATFTAGTMPALATRQPSGKPPWPLLLIAGTEKSGKSYALASFSASELIGRMFVFELGEGAIDQYGAMPGSRFEIVEHDGTVTGLARQIWAAVMEPRGEDGLPNAIGLDSASLLWDLVVGEQQALANHRQRKSDAKITMDQWNVAKRRWNGVLDLLRAHQGPAILTARYEETVVMDDEGRPTKARHWKVKAEKNLPYEVDAIVEIREPRKAELTGVRSLVLQIPPGETLSLPDFTVDGLFRRMGLEHGAGDRRYTAPTVDGYVAEVEAEEAARDAADVAREDAIARSRAQTPAEWLTRISEAASLDDVRALWKEAKTAGSLEVVVNGQPLGDVLKVRGDALAAEPANPEPGTAAPPAEAAPPVEEPYRVVDEQPAEQAVIPSGDYLDEAAASYVAATAPGPAPDNWMAPAYNAPVRQPKAATMPDDPELRRDSPARRAVLTVLAEHGVTDEASRVRYDLPLAEVGTRRLREWTFEISKAENEKRKASA